MLRMNSSVTLPANAYLHFYHAYQFEDEPGHTWDGGLLEYDTGSGWIDAGSLIDYNGYNGVNRSRPPAIRSEAAAALCATPTSTIPRGST